jgi:hypothetical protein
MQGEISTQTATPPLQFYDQEIMRERSSHIPFCAQHTRRLGVIHGAANSSYLLMQLQSLIVVGYKLCQAGNTEPFKATKAFGNQLFDSAAPADGPESVMDAQEWDRTLISCLSRSRLDSVMITDMERCAASPMAHATPPEPKRIDHLFEQAKSNTGRSNR